MLTAIAIDAGTCPDRTENRRNRVTRKPYTVEKGGWIALEWETLLSDEFEQRIIHVSRERALQAMSKLAQGADFV